MDKLSWKKFHKQMEYTRLKATKTWNWRRAWLIFELGDLRQVLEEWQHRRMQRHIQWVIDPGPSLPEGTKYPPSPREQLEHLKQWHADHKPPFTERAQLAPRWRDDQVLHIPIPKGWTQDQKKAMRLALTTLCNTPVLGESPRFGKPADG